MKKLEKLDQKLTLNRETLRQLESKEILLAKGAGATVFHSVYIEC